MQRFFHHAENESPGNRAQYHNILLISEAHLFRGGPIHRRARIYAEIDGRDRRSAAVLWFERLPCCVAWLALLAARCCFAAARRGQQQLDRCALDSRRTPPTTQQQVEAMAHVVGARGVLLPRASTPECTSAAAATPHFRRGPQLAAACELTAPRHWDCRWHPLHPLPLSLCAASSHALDSSPTCASRARAS